MKLNTYQILYEVEKYHWWFLGRRRIVLSQIEKLFRGVMGVDCSEEALRFCQKRGHYNLCQANACNLPLSDESYDLITALDLIEHLDSDWQGLREFRRVLKKGGKILVFVPAF